MKLSISKTFFAKTALYTTVLIPRKIKYKNL